MIDVSQANLTNANMEGALVTGNTSFKNAVITGAGESTSKRHVVCGTTLSPLGVWKQFALFLN